jgi:hypothetical protein
MNYAMRLLETELGLTHNRISLLTMTREPRVID